MFPQADNSHTADVFITRQYHHFPVSSYLWIGSHSFFLNLYWGVHPWSQGLLLFICFACKGLTKIGQF